MSRPLAFARRHWLPLLFGFGILATWLPLFTTRVLPFHDASGIVGLGGALGLRDDPAARIRELYDLDFKAYPSVLYFGWIELLARIGIGAELAVSLFIALFALAGPPLALLLLLDAHRRPRYLALLAFPVAYHHQIWFGFLGSSAAITGLLLALAFARRLVEHGRPRDVAGLAAALLFVAAAHPFSLALTLGVAAPLLAWPSPDLPRPRGWRDWRPHLARYGLRLAAFVPVGSFLAGWFGSFFTRRTDGRPLLERMFVEVRLRPPALVDFPRFLEWLGNGYRGAWDELVPAVALVTLAAFLIRGARPDRPSPPPAEAGALVAAGAPTAGAAVPSARRARFPSPAILTALGVGWPAAALVLGYLLLPMQLLWPEHWWGVRVRCVAPAFLVAVALVRPRVRGLHPWALLPAGAAALAFLAFVTYDFASYFRGQVLAGFDRAVAEIPPGRSVLAFPVYPDPHYTQGHPYLIQHYVARKGGRAVPHLRGHRGSYWITMKEPPPSPPWGDPRQFNWDEHGAGWDYFLLELPPNRLPPDPMRQAPPGAVGQLRLDGRFLLWHRR